MTHGRTLRLLYWNGPLSGGLGLAMALGAGFLLTRLSIAEATISFGLIALAAGTLVEPLAGLVGGLFVGLLRAYLQAEVPQVPAQIGHLFIALAAASWLARGLARRDVRLPHHPLSVPLLGFIGAAWLSLWSPADLANYGLPEFVKWAEILLVLLIVADRVRPRHLPWLLGAVLLVGAFQAGAGVYQFGVRGEGPEHFLIPDTDFYRAYGTFEQPNPYAGYIGVTLALAVGGTWGAASSWWGHRRAGEKRGNRERIPHSSLLLYSTCAAAMLAALGMSWSRGAWIGFGAALAAMTIALPRRARWGLLLVGLAGALILLLSTTGLLPSTIVARLTDFAAGLRLTDVRGVGISDANYAVVERLAHWQAALEMWRNHFWIGAGLGCYEPAYPHFALVNWPIALGHAHNIYLNLLAETGLIGAIAYLTLWGAILWWTWKATRQTSGLARGIAVGLLGSWVHLAVHHLFDNLYVNNTHLLIGLLLGLLASVTPPADKQTKRP